MELQKEAPAIPSIPDPGPPRHTSDAGRLRLKSLDENIAVLDVEIGRRTKEDTVARRLMTIPGVGPITATAIVALSPAAETFKSGRDFAAWLGLTPLQKSTGGKQRLGATSKMGERTLRRLLIIGKQRGRAASLQAWCTSRLVPGADIGPQAANVGNGRIGQQDSRIVWALLSKGEIYRAPVVAA
jgi:transposase